MVRSWKRLLVHNPRHLGVLCLAAAMARSSSCSIIKAEAWGLREGLRVSQQFLGISSLAIEGDNMMVINSLWDSWKVSWEISSLILDSVGIIQEFQEVYIAHCCQEANQAANFMAHRDMRLPLYCIDFLSSNLIFFSL